MTLPAQRGTVESSVQNFLTQSELKGAIDKNIPRGGSWGTWGGLFLLPELHGNIPVLLKDPLWQPPKQPGHTEVQGCVWNPCKDTLWKIKAPQNNQMEIFQKFTFCMKFVLPLHHSLAFPNFQLLGKASALDWGFFHSHFQMKPHHIIWYGEQGKAQSGLRRGKTPDPTSPRKLLPLVSPLCSTTGELLAKPDPTSSPATLAAAPNPSPEEVTRALEYKRP